MSAKRPIVSVVVPTRNRETLLGEALESVRAQSIDALIEVVVVNDGRPLSSRLRRKLIDTLPLTLVEHNRGSGPATARNIGLSKATGHYISFLDDLYLRDHLSRAVEALESGCDLIYGGAAVAEVRVTPEALDLERFRRKQYQFDQRLLYVGNFIHTGAVVARRFDNTAARFDASLAVCEDWVMWLALTVALGYRARLLDSLTTIYHQVPGTTGMVAKAQLKTPSEFAVARDVIYRKWPADDPIITSFRAWLTQFELTRDGLIADGRSMPNVLFDAVLQYLHSNLNQGTTPAVADIDQFFEDTY